MKSKTIYTLTLFVFVVMWGIFFATTPASAQPAAQETVVPPEITVVPPEVNVTAIVPVTGADPVGPNLMTLLFYGFLGLLAIVLLVALFASANRTTYVRRDGPSDHDHLP
jgi:ABC-type dipeptide/oligopeptide/nickel transport system permease subunit